MPTSDPVIWAVACIGCLLAAFPVMLAVFLIGRDSLRKVIDVCGMWLLLIVAAVLAPIGLLLTAVLSPFVMVWATIQELRRRT